MLRQVELLTGQLDDNKQDIVAAIDSLNRLAISVNDQTDSIDSALEELPSALRTIDKQRGDLVKMLQSLNDLGDVGVRVIKASKDATIETVRQLDPVLTELANSGKDFVDAFDVFLTYPFVDEVVGRDPQVARNLHMGDYTNLSVELDVSLVGDENETGLPTTLPTDLPTIVDPTVILGNVLKCLQSGDLNSKVCKKVLASPEKLLKLIEECQKVENQDKDLCKQLNLIPGLPTPSGGGGGGGLPIPEIPGPAAAAHRVRPLPARRLGRTHLRLVDGRLRPRPRVPAGPRDGDRMITRRTKVQLMVFVLITLVGVSFVGARYARLDRLLFDDSYTVVAHFPDSGGIFAGGEVTYRGVQVGQVSRLDLTDDGVDVHLAIEKDFDAIPADTLAVVGNRSAVGEQYVELQPQADAEPFLEDGSEIDEADDPHADPDPAAALRHLHHGGVGRQGGAGDDGLRSSATPSAAPVATSRP